MSDLFALEIDREAFVIVATVADHHGVAPRILLGDNRAHRISGLRRQACYLMRQILDLSPSEIGRALGGMDHSSVRHAISQAEINYNMNSAYASEVNHHRLTPVASFSGM